uniref:Uncharacterized protein n=1 Tax=Candidatus Desulfatibia profunda TaxID=2841695 RepID=A0A8J6NVE6_9BACT|nr:hypothetical protein [Candidatus Desulfatibia profunda]
MRNKSDVLYLTKQEEKCAIAAIKFLNEPKPAVQIKELRGIYKEFERSSDAKQLVDSVSQVIEATGAPERQSTISAPTSRINLNREDLHLICFDFVS